MSDPLPELPAPPTVPQPPVLSPDGRFWWDGSRWQPHSQQAVTVTQGGGGGSAFAAGLFGCFGVGVAMVVLFGIALVMLAVCVSNAAPSTATGPLQWSAADCDYAVQTLANGVWDDRHAAYKAAAQQQPGLAAAYVDWVHHHEDEKSAAKVHCGSTRVAPVTDGQAIATLERARKIHFDGATWNSTHGRAQQALVDFENVAYYDRLLGLFRTGNCPDAYCNYQPGTPAAGDATPEH